MRIAFPLAIGADGRTATQGREDHVRGMVMQLLMTQAGERVNRPDLGGDGYLCRNRCQGQKTLDLERSNLAI